MPVILELDTWPVRLGEAAGAATVLARPREGLACEKNGREPMAWRIQY
jgi:hypothetical protein